MRIQTQRLKTKLMVRYIGRGNGSDREVEGVAPCHAMVRHSVNIHPHWVSGGKSCEPKTMQALREERSVPCYLVGGLEHRFPMQSPESGDTRDCLPRCRAYEGLNHRGRPVAAGGLNV